MLKLEIYLGLDDELSAKLYKNELNLIEENYIIPAFVKKEVKYFISYRRNSFERTIAVNCAKEQKKEDYFVEEIFNNLDITMDLDYFLNIGSNLNFFDEKKFAECYESEDTKEELRKQNSILVSEGITESPTIAIGKRKISGEISYEQIKQFIESFVGSTREKYTSGKGYSGIIIGCDNEQIKKEFNKCYPVDRLATYMKNAYTNKCDEVKGISFFGECEYTGESFALESKRNLSYDKRANPENTETIEGIKICTDSCFLEDKCYPFGYRKNEKFCSDERIFVGQYNPGKKCDNNFECGTNLCINKQCISESTIQKIMNWFRKIF